MSHVQEALRILLVGAGGREHALAWRLAQSPLVELIYVAPGNAGTAHASKAQNITVPADDFAALARFAVENGVRTTLGFRNDAYRSIWSFLDLSNLSSTASSSFSESVRRMLLPPPHAHSRHSRLRT